MTTKKVIVASIILLIGLAITLRYRISAPPLERDPHTALSAWADDVARRYPTLPEISVTKVEQLQSQGKILLVDTRSEEERRVSMIPGAISLAEVDLAQLGTRTLVAYCTIGERSAKFLSATDVPAQQRANLRGGILSWALAGKAMVDSKGAPSRRIHVYSRRYALPIPGYEAQW